MGVYDVDMTGRQVMVTGCTAGLGRAGAIRLAEMGAEVALVCRNRSKGETLQEEIGRRTLRDCTSLFVGDLGSQRDIRAIAEAYLETDRPLHVLFNNAGVIMQRRTETVDGFETTFGVNHIGYFLLTVLLVGRLEASAPARVVNTASDAHRFSGGRLDFHNLQAEKKFSIMRAYGTSKLANILFTRELARRLEGRGITVNAFHPGMVGSDFSKNNGLLARTVMNLLRPFSRSPLQGAETGIYLCSSPEVEGVTGRYYVDCREHEPAEQATNDEDAKHLWELSEGFTGASL
jgi:NAD(P)-dependent dehydrogenase (short-subunit alcohol dehydrogenase family)